VSVRAGDRRAPHHTQGVPLRAFASTEPLRELAGAPVHTPRTSVLAAPLELSPPKAATGAEALGLHTIADLLEHLPRDRREARTIDALTPGEAATVVVAVRSIASRPVRRRGMKPLVEATVADETGVMKVTFFNQPWLVGKYPAGSQLVLHGKYEARNSFRVAQHAPTDEAAGALRRARAGPPSAGVRGALPPAGRPAAPAGAAAALRARRATRSARGARPRVAGRHAAVRAHPGPAGRDGRDRLGSRGGPSHAAAADGRGRERQDDGRRLRDAPRRRVGRPGRPHGADGDARRAALRDPAAADAGRDAVLGAAHGPTSSASSPRGSSGCSSGRTRSSRSPSRSIGSRSRSSTSSTASASTSAARWTARRRPTSRRTSCT